MRHAVHFLPAGKGQHPVRILRQFRQLHPRGQILRTLSARRASKPWSLRNETMAASSETARHASTSLSGTFFRKYIGEFFEIPLAEHFIQI